MGDRELYHRYRPKSFKRVVGQVGAVASLEDFLKRDALPHTLLFVGPSGCGKTTLARICRRRLECSDADFQEINAADYRGIDMVRDIRQRVGLAPLGGKVRVYLIDEVHQLTSPAQDSFLKILEDTPAHVYFMLATTDPQKLKRTIITRATEIKLGLLTPKHVEFLITQIGKVEKRNLSEEVIEKIVDMAEGSARKALVLLNQIIGMEEEDKQLETLAKADHKRQAIDLARLLMKPVAGEKVSWREIAVVLKGLDDDAEGIRRMVLAYMTSVMLGKGTDKVYRIINAFRDNFYDSGKAGLVAACWEAIHE